MNSYISKLGVFAFSISLVFLWLLLFLPNKKVDWAFLNIEEKSNSGVYDMNKKQYDNVEDFRIECSRCHKLWERSNEWLDWCDERRIEDICPDCIEEECREARERNMRFNIHQLRGKYIMATCFAIAGILSGIGTNIVLYNNAEHIVIFGIIIFIISKFIANKYVKMGHTIINK